MKLVLRIFLTIFFMMTFARNNKIQSNKVMAQISDLAPAGDLPPKFSIEILIGNRGISRLEVYTVNFSCSQGNCSAAEVKSSDRKWQSPNPIPHMTEVKRVKYEGKDAIAAVTGEGVTVVEYPSGKELFKKNLTGKDKNLHSCEVLPDGNVVYACSNGEVGVLYKEGGVDQTYSNTFHINLEHAHGAVYHPSGFLYTLGYLEILKLKYESGSDKRGKLTVVEKIPFPQHYDSSNKNEPPSIADGGHDLFPYRKMNDIMVMSTGEHAFYFYLNSKTFNKHDSFYTIPSQKGNWGKKEVPHKGGIKAVSADPTYGVNIASSAPWFKELYSGGKDDNYHYNSDILLWSIPNKGICMNVDRDLTNNCKIKFAPDLKMSFYKARVFYTPYQ